MGKEILSGRNMCCLIILMILSGSLVSGAFTVMQDTWISILLIAVLFLPVMLMYSRIAKLHGGKGLFEIIEELFGPVSRTIIIIFILFNVVTTGGLVLQNYTEFTVVISLESTPKIPIMILLLLVSLYLAYKGPKLLGRWSFVIFIIIASHFIFTIIISANIMNVKNILPVFDHSIADISANSFTVGAIAVGETMIVLALFGYIKKEESSYKIYLPGMFIGVLIFTLVILRNLFILGPDMEEAAQFSTYMAMRVVRLGDFLERIESTISFVYILLGITKITLYISVASMGIAKLLKSADYKKLLVPAVLLIFSFGAIVFKNVMEMYNFVWIHYYISIPSQVVVPFIIWVTAEVKSKKTGKKVLKAS